MNDNNNIDEIYNLELWDEDFEPEAILTDLEVNDLKLDLPTDTSKDRLLIWMGMGATGLLMIALFPPAATAMGKFVTLKNFQLLKDQKEVHKILESPLELQKKVQPEFRAIIRTCTGQELAREIVSQVFKGGKFILFSGINFVQNRSARNDELKNLAEIALEKAKHQGMFKEKLFLIRERVIDIVTFLPLGFFLMKTKIPNKVLEIRGGEKLVVNPFYSSPLTLLLFLQQMQQIVGENYFELKDDPSVYYPSRKSPFVQFLSDNQISLIIGGVILIGSGIVYYHNRPIIHTLINKTSTAFENYLMIVLEMLRNRVQKKAAELKSFPLNLAPVQNSKDMEQVIRMKALKNLQHMMENFYTKSEVEEFMDDLTSQLRILDSFED